MSSADTAPCHPRVHPSLIPVTTLGSAAGTITRHGMALRGVPSVLRRTEVDWLESAMMPSEVDIATAATELMMMTK